MKIIRTALITTALIFSAGVMADPPMHGGDMQQKADYHQGQKAPDRLRTNDRVVAQSEYTTHHLRTPPRGYHWVRGDNNDYVLVAITSGIISQIVAGN